MVNGGIAQHKESLLPDPVHFLLSMILEKQYTSSNKWVKLCTINKVQNLLQKPELYLALETYLTGWCHTTGGFYKTSLLSSLVKFASYN